MSFFLKKHTQPSTEKTLKELNEKVQKLEQTLDELSHSGKLGNQITIENLNMKEPVLENLTFQLDQLKLDEVSGALNLGNNFGVTVHQKSKKSQQKKKKKEGQSRQDDEDQLSSDQEPETSSNFKRTSDGFQFHFNQT